MPVVSPMRIELELPTLRREVEFLEAVKASRKLHRGLVAPPATPERFRAFLQALHSGNRESYFVTVKSLDALAGVITISEIVRGSFQSAYIGYYALEPHAGAGYMREGLQKAIVHAFGTLKLHRLEANIQPTNERSLALAEGLGFHREGFSRRYLKVCGRWQDHERWALLAEDYR
jgi:[ribosomal protein S5]-alanine N-acetyltransferase